MLKSLKMYKEPAYIESSYNIHNVGQTLYDLVITHKPKVVLEFGIRFGYSTICMAQGVRDNGFGKVLSYDLFEDYQYKNSNMDIVNSNLKKENLTEYVTLEKQDFYSWLDNPTEFDLLHIDVSNTGETLELVKKKLSKQLNAGKIIVFEGGTEERDNVEWMTKYNMSKMYSKKDELDYSILVEQYPGLSKFN